ncbi:hypothetical protein RF11_01542 [Thelohanellus kitauei]|uniref:Uncharacterized protein n=1 Tax=Thelohanellus kitauei TaxID=669202 RepID=A0A0C2N506_THEKT|nr:hypothetical protein RF11_01542 [Thelohanellus kitauei]
MTNTQGIPNDVSSLRLPNVDSLPTSGLSNENEGSGPQYSKSKENTKDEKVKISDNIESSESNPELPELSKCNDQSDHEYSNFDDKAAVSATIESSESKLKNRIITEPSIFTFPGVMNEDRQPPISDINYYAKFDPPYTFLEELVEIDEKLLNDQPIPDLFEENVERYPQYDDPFDDESNDEKTVYSEYIESLELKPEGNTDFKNVPKVLGIDTKAEEHQTNHIYLDYENFNITNIDIDILLDSSANVLKDSIKFDDKLFCDAVFVPSRRGASNSGHMCGTKKRYRCVVDGCGRVIASKENLKV